MVNFFSFVSFLLLFTSARAQDTIIVSDTIEPVPFPVQLGEQWIEPIEIEPKFPGGDSVFYAFIKMNLEYPVDCIQGIVYVKFLITETGEIDSVQIIRGINDELDLAALNLVRSMPNWTPAISGTQKIPMYFTLPIGFNLSPK